MPRTSRIDWALAQLSIPTGGSLIRWFSRMRFNFCQRLGVHITPVHFSSPIPDTRTLKDDLWQKSSELIGINMNEAKQLELLDAFARTFKDDYRRFPRTNSGIPFQYHLGNDSFGPVDAEVLYCMIRYFKPERIMEVGSGFSTFLSFQAVQANKEADRHYDCELVAIDPYPRRMMPQSLPRPFRLVPKAVQEVPVSEFLALRRGDILFVDSSHVVRIGSDVNYVCLEVLPRLETGVLVHFHDVFLPSEYPKAWVLRQHWFWSEQYLLQALLTFSDAFEVLWAGSFLSRRYPEKLEKAFDSYRWRGRTALPGSFWLRKVR